MLPVIPQSLNKLLQDGTGRPSAFPFPPNIAEKFTQSQQQDIFRWMLKSYIWPQIMERQPQEARWQKLLEMSKASWKYDNLNVSEATRQARQQQARDLEGISNPDGKCILADTVIFDAVDRLNNLNHFVSFKESLPMRFEWPQDMATPMENDVYSPSDALIKSANGWLKFNADGTNFYRKHWMTNRHHYTYGCSFANSEFEQKIGPMMRRQPDNTFREEMELLKIGVTFEPISIRKLWLNYRLTPYDMEYQPCPFFYEVMPKFAIIANPYEPTTNPFGFVNLLKLAKAVPNYLFSSQETSSFEEALKLVNPEISLQALTPKELSMELKWTLYPMLPCLDLGDQKALAALPEETKGKLVLKYQNLQQQNPDQQIEYIFDDDGTLGLPLSRYIMEVFGNSLNTGEVTIIRLQKNFYPHDSLPIYGSAHMPSVDEGAYPSAIGDILECHYIQITKALGQFLDNKDLQNDPPAKVQTGSPAKNKNLNKPGGRISVNSMKDYEKDTIIDGTQTTPAFLQMVRGQAQTSSKATNAILGEALGSRTSATEASNVFQTAMSGATTDINLFNFDISGGYAQRCWEYGGLWVDPDILASITGQYGFVLTPQSMQIRLFCRCDIGSTYIESITRQQNIRYVLETLGNNPNINVGELVKMLMKEWKFTNVDRLVNDGGRMEQVNLANLQAAQTYLGELVMVDPDQDHSVAIKVKVSYLKDRDSVWNKRPEFVINSPKLVQQIQQHQFYLQLQLLQQQTQALQMNTQSNDSLQSLQTGGGGPPPIQLAGQVAQQQGGMI